MSTIPSKVLSQHVRECLSGRRVTAGVFMTFTLEPAFFEEEIVTLLAGDALIQEPKLRLLQLEEALRGDIGPIAVYYDQAGLRPDGGKTLDIRYVPVRAKAGVFHPKLVLLLTEPTDPGGKLDAALICGVLSANLTKSGWWSSVECAHFEVVSDEEVCAFRDDLRRFLREVRRLGGRDQDHESLERIEAWLRNHTKSSLHSTIEGRLRTRLVAGTQPLLDFLEDVRGEKLHGASLEIIAPFIDESKPTALTELVERFDIREARVFLPTKEDGTASVKPGLYDAVKRMDGCAWAKLPQDVLKLGKEKNATSRGVHAKVYRFLKRSARYEAILVGSHNLSVPAHGAGRNVEASFLIEREHSGPLEWWLTTDARRPARFELELPQDEDVDLEAFIPLQVSYDWTTKALEVMWGGRDVSAVLHVTSAGSEVFAMSGLEPGEWIRLGDAESAALQQVLVSSTLLQVAMEDGRHATILVQESGMARKPSLIASWSIADVLEYWSRLTPEQRSAYLIDKAGSVPEEMIEDADRAARLQQTASFFTSFAGLFHGFEMLRKQVLQSLADGHDRQAEYRLFGQRYDSLPVVVERIVKGEEKDPLQSYLLLLCTRQLARELRGRDEPFFEQHRADLDALERHTRHADTLRGRLDLGPDGDEFLKWFERHFLRNLRSPEETDVA